MSPDSTLPQMPPVPQSAAPLMGPSSPAMSPPVAANPGEMARPEFGAAKPPYNPGPEGALPSPPTSNISPTPSYTSGDTAVQGPAYKPGPLSATGAQPDPYSPTPNLGPNKLKGPEGSYQGAPVETSYKPAAQPISPTERPDGTRYAHYSFLLIRRHVVIVDTPNFSRS